VSVTTTNRVFYRIFCNNSHFVEQRVILSASDTDSRAYAVEIL